MARHCRCNCERSYLEGQSTAARKRARSSVAAGQDYQTDFQLQLPAECCATSPGFAPQRSRAGRDLYRGRSAISDACRFRRHRFGSSLNTMCPNSIRELEPGRRIEKSFRPRRKFRRRCWCRLPTRKEWSKNASSPSRRLFRLNWSRASRLFPIANGSERTREGRREFKSDRSSQRQSCIWRLRRAGGSSPRKFRWSCVSAAKESISNSK